MNSAIDSKNAKPQLNEAAAAEISSVTEIQQYLSFTLGGDLFAINIASVREILEYEPLTEIPMTPTSIRGVINLRGTAVPVIDLSARFGGERTEISRRSCIVILEVSNEQGIHVIGVVVDSVNEVLEIPPSEIEPTPSLGASIRTEFIAGMGKVNGDFIILLDIAQLLSLDELSELDAVAIQAGGSAEDKAGEIIE